MFPCQKPVKHHRALVKTGKNLISLNTCYQLLRGMNPRHGNSCDATSKCGVSAEGWSSCTGLARWSGWTFIGEQHLGCIAWYQGFGGINPLRGMPRNLQTASGYRRQPWFEYKLLLIWATPSRNNYQCLREKPDATQQLTAILNHIIGLKLECCLSDRPLLRLTSLAARTCCLKRRKTQNLTLAVVNYLRIPPKRQSGLMCSTLALGWKPDSHSRHDRKPLEASYLM